MFSTYSDNSKIQGIRLNQSQGIKLKHKIGITVSAIKPRKSRLIYSYPVPIPENIQNHIGVAPYIASRKDYVINLSPMHEPFHLYEFTPESFKENAELNGYEVTRIENWVGEVYGPKYLKKYIKKYMVRSGQGMQLMVWLRKKD
jgi:hypothetical protein